ncbi:hypothetical protein V2J09_003354 [Rumex salicifolius]
MNSFAESEVTDSRKRRRRDKKKNQPSLVKCKSSILPNMNSVTVSTVTGYGGIPLDLNSYFPSDETNFDLEIRFESFDNKPTYPRQILKKNPLKTVIGMRLEKDILSLLSNGGKRDYLVRNNGAKVPVDSVVGKYLVICCFLVPLLTGDTGADICRAMIAAYSASYNNNFEVVMVAKMTSATMADEDEEAAFNSFFAAFPCLAIPFSDTKSRESLCYSFNLGLTKPWLHYSAVVLDPNQTVLQTNPKCFLEFGAAGFPFDAHRINALTKQHSELCHRLDFEMNWTNLQAVAALPPVSLVQLLGFNLLFKSGDPKVVINVSDLGKSKYVGLYLCCDGLFMEKLNRVHQMCIAQDLEFEIVLLYAPFRKDTASFVSHVNSALEKHRISSWWVMPFVDEVSRRLWRIRDLPSDDELIIWGEGGNSAEFDGREVIDRLGETCYPFARKIMADDIFSRLRSLNLYSLLGGVDGYLIKTGSDNDDGTTVHVPVSELNNRKVLLYVDWYGSLTGERSISYYNLVRSHYELIKKHYPHSEVVYVPLDQAHDDLPLPVMPWLMLPFKAAIEGEVVKLLFPEGKHTECSSLIAFGKGGLIRSRNVIERLHSITVWPRLFADTLFKEIARNLCDYYECTPALPYVIAIEEHCMKDSRFGSIYRKLSKL